MKIRMKLKMTMKRTRAQVLKLCLLKLRATDIMTGVEFWSYQSVAKIRDEMGFYLRAAATSGPQQVSSRLWEINLRLSVSDLRSDSYIAT